MDYFRTQYEKLYDSEKYYWGLEPAKFLDELIDIVKDRPGRLKVLDIGCGEGKDAVYMAEKGFDVTAFDITESGIRKTKALAEARNAEVNAFVADINDFELDGKFDIVYSTGTVQYLQDDRIDEFFDKVGRLTEAGGIVYFNVFVDKPFLELPPDWDKEEKLWKTGELFTHFADWKIIRIAEKIFKCSSGETEHYHCMDTVVAEKV